MLFENSPVNLATGQPAIDHLRAALERGMHAITANKGPVVHAYRELTDLAKTRGRKFYFEFDRDGWSAHLLPFPFRPARC